jgi:signal transduction histidine kinase/CheY-like chemotaxis protein
VSVPLLSVRLQQEHDIVAARQRARQIAFALGFDATDQTRIATALSEIARNAYVYAGGGRVEYSVEGTTAPQLLILKVVDQGSGIPNLTDVLSGRYRSATGMGLGIVGTRRLMDHFSIDSTATGTTVTLKKLLPPRTKALPADTLTALAGRLSTDRPKGPLEEIQQQNQELLHTLDILRARQEDLERVNRELEDTNRGVVALYAELDERTDHLRRADELKTRFLSNMTHEFRTPVNSILALTGLLAERLESKPDEKDEVYYIRKSAQQLSEIVNDLLDLAKVEAGKIDVRPAPFEVQALFGALRGMLRPLLLNQSLALTFDADADLPPIYSDESKVSQILRNFISNALKYTEAGEVRVTARLTASRNRVEFSVADTGIGIPSEQLHRVFEEFVQIENPLQRRTKGTGLGLPLSKRLAELLGGEITFQSTLGVGSTFTLVIPLVYRDTIAAAAIDVRPNQIPVLVIEDSDEDLLLYERALTSTRYQLVPARSVAAAIAAMEAFRPRAIILDIRLNGEDSWDVLARLKREEATTDIPVVVISTLDERRKGLALGADAYCVKPVDGRLILQTLDDLTHRDATVRVLSIDDEESARFIVRNLLSDGTHEVMEAASGKEGLQSARHLAPDIILLDVRLTDMSGVDVRQQLRRDPVTARVPVVMVTGQQLTAEELTVLGDTAVLPKSALTRASLQNAIRGALSAGGAARQSP